MSPGPVWPVAVRHPGSRVQLHAICCRPLGAKPHPGFPAGSPPGPRPKGTTVLALRYADGVVMAGDRQATEGNLVAHRQIRKVFPADSYSGVAIAGTAGLAIEMVRLFQVELEHYEKIEGSRLSLEGQGRLPGPAGAETSCRWPSRAWSSSRSLPATTSWAARGRLYTYDVVGGRYEENDFGSTGSGARLAKSYLRTAFSEGLSAEEACRVAVGALVVGRAGGHRHRWPRPPPRHLPTFWSSIGPGSRRIADDRDPHRPPSWRWSRSGDVPVLRPSRTAGTGQGRVRPQGNRPGPLDRRHRLCRRCPAPGREPIDRPEEDQRGLRPHRLRRGGPLQRVRDTPQGRHPPGRPDGISLPPR